MLPMVGKPCCRRADEVQTFQKPVFTTALQNVESGESSSAHLAARLIPVGDPSLRVEWLKDGKVLETGKTLNCLFFCKLSPIKTI